MLVGKERKNKHTLQRACMNSYRCKDLKGRAKIASGNRCKKCGSSSYLEAHHKNVAAKSIEMMIRTNFSITKEVWYSKYDPKTQTEIRKFCDKFHVDHVIFEILCENCHDDHHSVGISV